MVPAPAPDGVGMKMLTGFGGAKRIPRGNLSNFSQLVHREGLAFFIFQLRIYMRHEAVFDRKRN